MNEGVFWIAYLGAFVVALVIMLVVKRYLWLISIGAATLVSAFLAALTIWHGTTIGDWLPTALLFNFMMAWFFAAAAIYVLKVVRA